MGECCYRFEITRTCLRSAALTRWRPWPWTCQWSGVASPTILDNPDGRGIVTRLERSGSALYDHPGGQVSSMESYSSRGGAVRTTKQLSITLPNEMAAALRERVRSGEYASESEVIRDGLRTLFARDRAVERWLHDEAASAYDELRADPSIAISASDVREYLAALHAERRGQP